MKITSEIMSKCTPYGDGVFGYRVSPRSIVKYWYREHCKGCGEPCLVTRRYIHGISTIAEYCTPLCARKNTHYTDEQRERWSRARKGKHMPESAKQAIREFQTGRKKSPEAIAKVHTPEVEQKRTASLKAVAESTARRKMLPNGEAAANALLSYYRKNADDRGIAFALEKDVFLAITKKDCFYCGIEPQQVAKTNAKYTDPYLYNGVDRVNSSLDYLPENVVPCCVTCNRGKGTRTAEDFLSWARLVHDFDNQSGTAILMQIPAEPYGTAPGFQTLFGKYLDTAKVKHYDFDLTKDQFDTLVRTQCQYCGTAPHRQFNPLNLSTTNRCFRSSSAKRPIIFNGLDRVNSSGGYTTNNAVPCCTECNFAKRVQTVEEFYAWVTRIVTYQDSLAATKRHNRRVAL